MGIPGEDGSGLKVVNGGLELVGGAGLGVADVDAGLIELVLRGGGGGAFIGLWLEELFETRSLTSSRTTTLRKSLTFHRHCWSKTPR